MFLAYLNFFAIFSLPVFAFTVETSQKRRAFSEENTFIFSVIKTKKIKALVQII